MYKKVHHHITEEHFHHPHGVELAAVVAKKLPPPVPPVHSTPITHNVVNPKSKKSLTESEISLINAMAEVWSLLAQDLNMYATSVTSTGEDLSALQNKIKMDSPAVDSILSNYYTPTQVGHISTARNNMLNAIMSEISATKNNAANQMVKNATANAINNYAGSLAGVNPAHWPVNVVSSMWSSAVDTLVTKVQTRMRTDWSSSINASNSFYSRIAGPYGFASIVAKGIISQFPEKFTS